MSRITTRELTLSALFTALIVAGSSISIPVGPVPFTLQVMVVMLAALVLGPRLAALSVVAYLCLGLVAPVFAGGTSGPSVLIGPTAGYLWGFVAAALVSGRLARGAGASTRRLIGASLAGLFPIYGLGAVWLALQTHASFSFVLVAGVLQFLPFDVLKAIAAGLAARSLVNLPLGLPALQKGQ